MTEPITTYDQIAARISAHPVDGDHHNMRTAFEAIAPPAPEAQSCALNGVRVQVHNPSADRSILFLHGGGYVFGSPQSHGAAAAHLARLTGARVVVPEYRCAPEATWPAPLEDARAVLAGLDLPVPVVGISAGGHLAINLALSEPDRVARLTLISPNTDRTGQSRTRIVNSERDLMNDDARDKALSKRMLGEVADDHPHASPLIADLARLPPLWMTASTVEVLLDDTLLFAAAAARAGVAVATEIVQGQCHMWPLWPDLPTATATWAAIAAVVEG